jgi:hypothetical protein
MEGTEISTISNKDDNLIFYAFKMANPVFIHDNMAALTLLTYEWTVMELSICNCIVTLL